MLITNSSKLLPVNSKLYFRMSNHTLAVLMLHFVDSQKGVPTTTPRVKNLDFARIPLKFYKKSKFCHTELKTLPIFQFLHGVEIRSKKHTQKIEVRTCIVQIKQTIHIFRRTFRRILRRNFRQNFCQILTSWSLN